ncbi:hypothetical protein AB0L06_35820 [Spirillospora sp. NPDC052269]
MLQLRSMTVFFTAFLLTTASLCAVMSRADAAMAFGHIDASPFVLDPSDSFQRYGAIVSRIESAGKVSKASSLGAAIDGPQDFHPTWGLCHSTGITSTLSPSGFCWDPADDGWDTANWRPQGISGSWDAQPNLTWSGRRIAVVSWHGIQSRDDFARLTFVDYTDTTHLKYRDVLLVVPKAVNGTDDFTAFDWNHADGVVWYGNTLLVANGGRLHAFSLNHLWTMTRSQEEIGLGADGSQAPSARWHRYALPEVGEYYPGYAPSDGAYIACTVKTGARPCLNSLSLDRRGAARDSMVSAEYVSDDSAGGRAIRWPMDYTTALPLLGADSKVHADEAFTSPIWHMQGAASDGTDWYLSGTCASGSGTCVHKAVPDQAPKQSTQVTGGLENLSYQPSYNGSTPALWGLNEGDNRFVFHINVP